MTTHTLAAALLGCKVDDLDKAGLLRSEELPVLCRTGSRLDGTPVLTRKEPDMTPLWVPESETTKVLKWMYSVCPHGAVVIG